MKTWPSQSASSKGGSSTRRSDRSRVILGIDPGSRFMGFGAVRVGTSGYQVVSYGVIAPPAGLAFNDRLAILADEFAALLERLQPDVTVVEKVFLGKNADSAFKLGHARGLVIAGAVRSGCQVVEYATRAVKKGITGNGGASKEQVQAVLFSALGLASQLTAAQETSEDASDALALAFYHLRNLEVGELFSRSQSGPSRSAAEEEL